jgi:CheY-like chemotaxis protein
MHSETAGLDLIKVIRKFDKKVKIIMSTVSLKSYEKEALAVGANAYLPKPYDFEKTFLQPLGVQRNGEASGG